MLALAEYEASRCPCGCGHNSKDTIGPEVPGRWKVRKVRCHARDALVRAQQGSDNKPEDAPQARVWWTEKVR